jgi:acetyl-CoA acyltransferase
MTDRVAIVDGIRTPFCKQGGVFFDLKAEDLGAYCVRELVARLPVKPDEVSELVFGNVIQPPDATNIARVLSVKGGLPVTVPAFTVNRNCASGMEAIVTAMTKIQMGHGDVMIAGGCESMSRFPVLFSDQMRKWLWNFSKAKFLTQRLFQLLSLRPSFFKPHVPGIQDPLCGLVMGQTAEILVRDFKITREEQDEFALMSHERAAKARPLFKEEIIPIPIPPKNDRVQEVDDGVREGQTLEQLAKLKPVFDKLTGSVTAGTSSQVTDGAAAVLLMRESTAKSLGIKPLGYIRDWSRAGLDPSRMGLGPAFAIAKILKRTGYALSDFDLIEINEAFAAQVIACKKALADDAFCKEKLSLNGAAGMIDSQKLNVNGGAIALGHPVGASGARIVLSLLKELNRRGKNLGLASLCVGGGQGEALVVEVE